jgi:hypothetical protein
LGDEFCEVNVEVEEEVDQVRHARRSAYLIAPLI